jgi:glycosyl hydrolase family 2
VPPLARVLVLAFAAVAPLAPAVAAQAAVPHAITLSSGWQIRGEPAAAAAVQPGAAGETAPESARPLGRPVPVGRASQLTPWRPVRVPSVFDARALPGLFAGSVNRYRLDFVGPRTPRGFRWLLAFEEVRRSATVFLNGRELGRDGDTYTPFSLEARGLRARRPNRLEVVVDSRKDPRLFEGWWNWGGIVRPVHLVPVGRANLADIGLLSRVRCRGPATRCGATLLVDAKLERRGRGALAPRLSLRLRAPGGGVVARDFPLGPLSGRRRHLRLALPVPRPQLWSPGRPRLYRIRLVLSQGGRVQQVVHDRVGLRSVSVKRGHLYLNNRPLRLRGASVHEDMPGHGAALSGADIRRIVRDLEQVGADVTRAHYLLNERLLDALDRAGIMVWSQAPIWQRDHHSNLLQFPSERRRARLTVRRTVMAARNHPSVIVHSVANELSYTPDERPGTRPFLTGAAADARRLDPTLPVAVDIKARRGYPKQSTYRHFDALGINQYFGWYPWVKDFTQLQPYLRKTHARYPRLALVMTEFGAEGRPDLAAAPPEQKGGYAFQAAHAERTLDLVDRLPFLSGAIYWTLREFEAGPGWRGGAGPRPPGQERVARHNKGLLTYDGVRKPAWYVARRHFVATPSLGR